MGFKHGGNLHRDFSLGMGQPGILHECSHKFGHVARHHRQIESQSQAHSGSQFAHLEHFVNQALHAADRAGNSLAIPGLTAGATFLKQLSHHVDGLQGIAQIVAQDRQQLSTGHFPASGPGGTRRAKRFHQVTGDGLVDVVPRLRRPVDGLMPFRQ